MKIDSKASLKFTGLMAQNYVAIDFGTPGGVAVENGAFCKPSNSPT